MYPVSKPIFTIYSFYYFAKQKVEHSFVFFFRDILYKKPFYLEEIPISIHLLTLKTFFFELTFFFFPVFSRNKLFQPNKKAEP
ncbi:hypothetical protein UP17_08165 [Peribacillus simplex]|nr:hypothetical protein UP17_08165 [Peribacillus simplex]